MPAAATAATEAEDLDVLQALACMRALGVGIEDMRVYQANRSRGHEAAAEQRDLLLRHAERIEAEIAAQYTRLDYLRAKAALWDARARGDAAAEAAGKAAGQRGVSTISTGRKSDEPSTSHRRKRLPGNAPHRRAAAGRKPVRTTVRWAASEETLRAAVDAAAAPTTPAWKSSSPT